MSWSSVPPLHGMIVDAFSPTRKLSTNVCALSEARFREKSAHRRVTPTGVRGSFGANLTVCQVVHDQLYCFVGASSQSKQPSPRWGVDEPHTDWHVARLRAEVVSLRSVLHCKVHFLRPMGRKVWRIRRKPRLRRLRVLRRESADFFQDERVLHFHGLDCWQVL